MFSPSSDMFYLPIFSSSDANKKPIFVFENAKLIEAKLIEANLIEVNSLLRVHSTLTELISQINKIMSSYNNGDINAIDQFIKSGDIYFIASQLINICNDYPQYKDIQIIVEYNLDVLNSLNKILADYLNCAANAADLAIAQEYAKILKDPVLLQEYINNLKKNIAVLPALFVTVINPVINPNILAYITKYGIPSDGVYDTTLMAEIIYNLDAC